MSKETVSQMRPIKFEIKLRRKDGTDEYFEHLTLDDLLNRNGALFHPNIWEVVYKRQFTGLTDKAGKEIYESDCFEIIYSYDLGLTNRYEKVIGEVVFKFGQWMLKHLHPKTKEEVYAELFRLYKDKEVIGNIFEHSELLAK